MSDISSFEREFKRKFTDNKVIVTNLLIKIIYDIQKRIFW